MIETKGGMFVGLQVDGYDYPLDAGGFHSIQIVSNCRLGTMSAVINLMDMPKTFNTERTIGDGTRLTLQLGKSASQYNSYNLRVFTTPSKGNIYSITAYWDSYQWFMATAASGQAGTSAEAIKAIATACGLTVDADPTADSQMWLPGLKRNCIFAQDIASKGFASDNSLMLLGQTMSGVVRYKDASKIKTTNQMPVFMHTKPPAGSTQPTYQVADHQFVDMSGFNNARGGYSSQMIEQNILSTAEQVVHNKVNVRRISQLLNVNKDIHQSIQQGRIKIAPINVGNVHDNYQKAHYQNERAKQMYSVGVEVLTTDMTLNLDLFDPFQYVPLLPSTGDKPPTDERNKAVYIVTAKAIKVTNGNYLEKIQGLSTGPALDPSQAGALI